MLAAETMIQQQQPTPGGSSELEYGLHHLVQHNAGTNFRHEMDDYLHPGQPSGYGSPGHMQYPDLHDPSEVGLGIHFEGQGGPGPTYYDGQTMHGLPYMRHGTYTDPPTPHSTNSEGGRRTRSGRSVVRNASRSNSRTRVSKSPKPKKSKAGKNKPSTPKLSAPLSELTKDYAHIPLKDMNEWVNRPAEVRRQEVEKRNGYVTRPMNSFMLYRSAYAERTKEWCSQNNHQVVSSVSGESWPLEPPEIREMYNEYARIERINHQNAHPTYKFSPSKVGSSRKRKGTDSDEEDEEPSDIDDPDGDWGPPGSRSRRNRSSKRQEKEPPYPAYNTVPSNYAPYGYEQIGGMNPSAWEATNEGRPPPAALGSANMYNRYYQTTVHQNASAPGWEDVRMRAMEAPSMQQYATGQSLIGLPGGQHHDLLHPYSQVGTPMQFEEHVDPMLLPMDGNAFREQVDGMQFGGPYGAPLEQSHFGEFDYRPGAWPVDPTLGPPLGEGSELDQLDG